MTAEPIQLRNSTPFDLIVESIEDLIGEARNYADGSPVETQGQADDVSRIIDGLNLNAKALDAERVVEKAPLDKQIAAIQDRYGLWIADRKNKTPGKVFKAVDALKASLQPYLAKLDAEKREAERVARDAADKAAKDAAEAMRAAAANDLHAREEAEALIADAEAAQKVAKAAAGDKAHASGGSRAMGLRSVWKAELKDAQIAAGFFWKRDPSVFNAFLQKLADEDVRAGKRSIPGFDVTEARVL
jgi:hypothetical protein